MLALSRACQIKYLARKHRKKIKQKNTKQKHHEKSLQAVVMLLDL